MTTVEVVDEGGGAKIADTGWRQRTVLTVDGDDEDGRSKTAGRRWHDEGGVHGRRHWRLMA